MDKQQSNLNLSKFSGINRFFTRIKVHAIALLGSITFSVFSQNSLEPTLENGSVLCATYFGSLLWWRYDKDLYITILSAVFGFLALFTPAWPYAMGFVGMMAFILNTKLRGKFLLGDFISVFIILAAFSEIYPLFINASSFYIYLIIWALTTVINFAKISSLSQKFANAIRNYQVRKQQKAEQKEKAMADAQAKKAQEQAEAEQQEQQKKRTVTDDYLDLLAKIKTLKSGLPPEIYPSIDVITLKTHDILICLEQDPRDIQSGQRFLNRYLPMIINIMDRFQYLQQQSNSPQMEEVAAMTMLNISTISKAFEEMHQKLLSNDLDDLIIDLKTMDRVMRTQGIHRNQDDSL